MSNYKVHLHYDWPPGASNPLIMEVLCDADSEASARTLAKSSVIEERKELASIKSSLTTVTEISVLPGPKPRVSQYHPK